MAEEKPPKAEEKARGQEPIDPRTHRRLLRYINAARSPEAIAFAPKNEIRPEEPDPVVRRPVFEHELEHRERLTEAHKCAF